MINLGWLNYRGLYCQSIGNYHNPWRPNWMTANLLPILSVETHLVKAGISLKTFLAVKPSQIYGWLLTMTWRKSQITLILWTNGDYQDRAWPKATVNDTWCYVCLTLLFCGLHAWAKWILFFFWSNLWQFSWMGVPGKQFFLGWRVDHEVPKLSESWHT